MELDKKTLLELIETNVRPKQGPIYLREGVPTLILNNNPLSMELKNTVLPEDLVVIYLSDNGLESIDDIIFPASLKVLTLQGNHLTSIENVRFPKDLKRLYLSGNYIKSIDGINFPENLILLYLNGLPLTSIKHLWFSEGLVVVQLGAIDFVELEDIFICPQTRILSKKEPMIREAVYRTCTARILSGRPTDGILVGMWWARVSYLLGGVTYQDFDSAL